MIRINIAIPLPALVFFSPFQTFRSGTKLSLHWQMPQLVLFAILVRATEEKPGTVKKIKLCANHQKRILNGSYETENV